MQDAITAVYQRFLPAQELATGRLLSINPVLALERVFLVIHG